VVGWSGGRVVGRSGGRAFGWSVGRAVGRSGGRAVGRTDMMELLFAFRSFANSPKNRSAVHLHLREKAGSAS